MNKTAIVIGATGLIGKHLTQLICEDPRFNKVVTITRRAMPWQHDKLINHIIDFENMADHAELFQGDYLFSCLGSTLKKSGSIDKLRHIDLNYQFTAASLAASNKVPFYLLVSSSGANTDSRSSYLKMKGELEGKVKQLTFKQTAIFQPSLLIGERQEQRLAEGIGSKLLPLLCKLPGLKKYRPIQGQQVAQKMLEVSLNQKMKLQFLTLDKVFPHQL